jgi:hypothetical protein
MEKEKIFNEFLLLFFTNDNTKIDTDKFKKTHNLSDKKFNEMINKLTEQEYLQSNILNSLKISNPLFLLTEKGVLRAKEYEEYKNLSQFSKISKWCNSHNSFLSLTISILAIIISLFALSKN